MASINNEVTETTYCACDKRMSQWEELMRKFSQTHQEKCRLRPSTLNIPRHYRSTKYFPTGSQYAGSWDILGMSGKGIYTFPNGVIYEGEFEDGMFHGKGQLRYEDGATLEGHFFKGVMIDRKLTFADGLEYDEEDWKYCKMPDRRYAVEYDKGLQPAGRSNITANMPPREIPPGFYDSGDGFYNPITKSVYDPDDPTSIIRSPALREQKWIIENCRVAPDPVLGPRQHLYEQWSEPQDTLPSVPPPASAVHSILLDRKPSVYEEESEIFKVTDEFYDPEKLEAELSSLFQRESIAPPPRVSVLPESIIAARRRSYKRKSMASARRDSSKTWKCERIKIRTPANCNLKVRTNIPDTNKKVDDATAKTTIGDDDRHRLSLHNCLPSSFMMFIADHDDHDLYGTSNIRLVNPK